MDGKSNRLKEYKPKYLKANSPKKLSFFTGA
jgi:hypothetical protein